MAKAVKRFIKKYGFAICVIALIAILCVTAIWLRRALIARAMPKLYASVPEATAPAEILAAAVQYALPSAGEVLRGYSPETPVWSETMGLYETHDGVDYAFYGAGEARACADGRVASVESNRLWGLTVTVAHSDGCESVYASLDSAHVKAGERVYSGQTLGIAGTSAACERALGAHIHFTYRVDGQAAPPPFALD